MGMAALVFSFGVFFAPGTAGTSQASVGTECPAGTYSSTGYDDPNPCTDADAGFYVDQPGQTSETPCPPGTYSDDGATSCTPADPGYYAAGYENTDQTACPAGSTSQAAAIGCMPTTTSACTYWDVLVDGSSQPFSSQLSCMLYVSSSTPNAGHSRIGTVLRILSSRWGWLLNLNPR